jgi:hypothetical protein
MSAKCGFIIGRKGILYLVRESGKKTKLGLAIRGSCLMAFDKFTSTWHEVPGTIMTTSGEAVHVSVLRE